MRTINVPILKFDELSPKAKEQAKYDYKADCGFCHHDEYIESLEKLAEHFGGSLGKWEVDWFESSYSHAEFDMPEMTGAEIRRRLATLGKYNKRTGKGHGECKLTGVCSDEDAIDGFRIAFRKGERDLDALMRAAFDSWLKGGQADCAGFYEDEQFAEHCEANDYEFTEAGKFYHERAK